MSGMTLVEFLLARIEQRERGAYGYRELRPEPGKRFTWYLAEDEVTLSFEDGSRNRMPWRDFQEQHMELHLARPRQLAEAEAHRDIVNMIIAADDGQAHPVTLTLGNDILMAMAAPDADHPDYDPAWQSS